MYYKIFIFLIFLNLLVMCSLLISCAKSPQAKFYKVSSVGHQNKDVNRANFDDKLAIAINTVEIPDYLNRPQIVVKKERNEVDILEFHRWAGSFKDNLTLVIAENLSNILMTNRVYAQPRIKVDDTVYTITVTVYDIEFVLNEKVTMKGSYVIRDLRQKKDVLNKIFVYTEAAKTEKISQLVEILDLCLFKLSEEIASDIKKISNL